MLFEALQRSPTVYTTMCRSRNRQEDAADSTTDSAAATRPPACSWQRSWGALCQRPAPILLGVAGEK